MSPARASLMSSRWLACICSMRPTRSRSPLTEFMHLRAAGQHAGIDAHEGQRADERIGHDLEGETGEGLVVRALAAQLLVAVDLGAVDGGDVGRRRQVIDHGVEQRLHALVLEGAAAEHRHEEAGDRALADAALQRLLVRLLAVEIGLERGVVVLDRHLDQLGAVFRRLRLVGRRESRRRRTRRPAPRPSR